MATMGYWAPDGSAKSFGEAQWFWRQAGYELNPDGTKTKIGGAPAAAPAAPAASSPSTTSLGGMTTGGTGNLNLDQLTNIADPWASQRGQYQTQLSSLMKDPSSFLKSDLFKASTQAGLDAVNRSAAASGMLKSGNRLQALMDYGQKNAPENFFRMSDLLAGLGGARNQNPGGGLSALANLQNANTSAFSAETGRRAQEAGVNQYNLNRADQELQQQLQNRQQQQTIDQLSNWQKQQQQQSSNDYWNNELNRIKARSQAETDALRYY